MEDTHVLFEDGGLLVGAVFDGHGGPWWSVAAEAQFEAAFRAAPEDDAARLAWALAAISCDAPGGAVAAAFALRGADLAVANCGDVEIAWVPDAGDAAVLTVKHGILDPAERARVVASGALIRPPYIYDRRTGAGLMPTRGLGDEEFVRIGFLHEPAVARVRLLGPGWIVAACDGLWDVVRADELPALIGGGRTPDGLAALLVHTAATRRTSDNVTVMAVRVAP